MSKNTEKRRKEFAFNPPTRAEKAAKDASQWHQGSGTHADMAYEMASHHYERAMGGEPKSDAHMEAAQKWASAAEEEARHLKSVGGEWIDHREWKKSTSGQATKLAKAASRKAGVNPKDFDL